MSRVTIVQVQDDLGGSGAAEPLHFSVEGVKYVIDLNTRNRATFMRRLAVYMDAAQPDPPGYRVGPKRAKSQAATIRQWATDNGYVMADRGRIKAEISQAYADSLKS